MNQKKGVGGLGDSHSSFKGDLGPLENSKTAFAKTKTKQNKTKLEVIFDGSVI